MNKKIALSLFIILLAPILLISCSKKNSVYSEKKRDEMKSEASIIVDAVYLKMLPIKKREELDVIEGRKSISPQIQKGVQFKTKSVRKGTFPKKQFLVGADIPSLAFGIGPGEYSGQKEYTFYLLKDPTVDKEMLIGAEWESTE